ncbi:MAG: acyl-CoA thioesterase [Hydrogenophilus sp.]|nr:acyl-CoA thioesterase [Hydrogenophilus sp.]
MTELPEKQPALRVVPMPADLNPAGCVFGGWVMAMVDVAGSLPARRRARGRVATVAVDRFVFKGPILVGDVVSFYAEVVAVGRTSVTVEVEVYAERHPALAVVVKVAEARLTYVAVDERGYKRLLPPEKELSGMPAAGGKRQEHHSG